MVGRDKFGNGLMNLENQITR